MSAIPLQRMAGVLSLRHTRSAKAINIESDLIWVLHVKKSPLGEFAGEVRIDLPKLGESGLQFIRSLQVPQGSDTV
jgi:hypothetical protein